jgi:hypothetical protein
MISHKHKCIFVHVPKNAGSSVERAFGFDDITYQGTARHSPVWAVLGYWQSKVNYREYPLSIVRGKKKLFPRAHHCPDYVNNFEGYHKFAIVRNPWDRLVSTWKYDQRLLSDDPYKLVANYDQPSSKSWLDNRRLFLEAYTKDVPTFNDFVRNIYKMWYGAKGQRGWMNLSESLNPPDSPKYHWIKWHQMSQLTFLVDKDNNIRTDRILRYEHLAEDWATLCDQQGWDLALPNINKSPGKYYTEYYDDETVDMVAKRYAADIEYFGYEFGQ